MNISYWFAALADLSWKALEVSEDSLRLCFSLRKPILCML